MYFPGDTDLFPEMDTLAGHVNVALLPVWGWGPTIGKGHMNPERAAEAAAVIRPRLAVRSTGGRPAAECDPRRRRALRGSGEETG